MLKSRLQTVRHFSKLLHVHPTVKLALENKQPVVALESTLISHGLPYPRNFKVAKSLEAIVKEEGAVPATIALMNGKICVGLSDQQLHDLSSPTTRAVKVSTRDIPTVLTEKTIGGTTVAATMKIAHWAGIRVFATGGIGGVHRGAEESFDISADLIELGKTPVAVVCAGAKSILDIKKTLEVLETQGVNVIVYDNQPYFPGFFVPRTPFKAPFNTNSINHIANILRTTDELQLQHGTLVACPLPESWAEDGDKIGLAVEQALKEAEEGEIVNKDLTPFLLRRVDELTDSESLKVNVELLENNVRIASQLAKAYRLDGDLEEAVIKERIPPISADVVKEYEKTKILCLGAAILDFEVRSEIEPKNDGGYYNSELFCRAGGVGRNHAEGFHRLGNEVQFVTAIGRDPPGKTLQDIGLYFDRKNVMISEKYATATSMGVNIQGNIQHGFLSIGKIVDEISPEKVRESHDRFAESDYIVLDGNLNQSTIDEACRLASELNKNVWFDPTDVVKIDRMKEGGLHEAITGFSPNLYEFKRYCSILNVQPIKDEIFSKSEDLAHYLSKRISVVRSIMPSTMQKLLITLGPAGVVLISRPFPGADTAEIRSNEAPKLNDDEFVSASGAGDCFNAGFLTAHLNGLTDIDALEAGKKCAGFSLRTLETVPATISNPSVF